MQTLLQRLTMNSLSDAKDYETEIDHIVYHLYDLTYDEVLIVDSEAPITHEQNKSFIMDTYGQS